MSEIPNMALVLLNIEKRVPEKSAKNTERKGVPKQEMSSKKELHQKSRTAKMREIPNMALVLLNIEKRVPEKSAKNTERKGVPELQKETIGITSEIKDSQNERNRPTHLALVLQVTGTGSTNKR